jgi:hypothetical protein
MSIQTPVTPPPPIEVPKSIGERMTYWRKKHKRALAISASGFGIFALMGLGLLGAGVVAWVNKPYEPPMLVNLDNFQGDYASLGDGDFVPAPPQDPNHLPTIVLGDSGGMPELDRCDGTFIHMEDYARVDNLQPTYAAHNNCGGEIILPLERGSRLMINNEEYEVVSVRNLPKEGSLASQLLGMSGEILIQSCYYLPNTYMHFIGISKVGALQQEKINPLDNQTPEPTESPNS